MTERPNSYFPSYEVPIGTVKGTMSIYTVHISYEYAQAVSRNFHFRTDIREQIVSALALTMTMPTQS